MLQKIIIPLALLFLPLQAQTKVAVVKMAELFNKYPATVTFSKQIESRKSELESDKRIAAMKEMVAEIEAIDVEGKKLIGDDGAELRKQDKNSPTLKKIRELMAKRKAKQDEANSINKDFMEYRDAKLKEINRDMASHMRQYYTELSALVRKVAAEQGFDLVYDTSGYTNTGLPVIVYMKPDAAKDITAEVLKQFSATPTESTAPESATPVKVKPNLPPQQ